MKAQLKDLIKMQGRRQLISFITGSDFSEEFDELKDKDVEITIKRHYKKRSLNANSYCWVLCERIAEKIGYTAKDDIYREAIRTIGVFKDIEDLKIDDAKTLRIAWEDRGLGWITEQVHISKDGKRVTVRFYYGSSSYNTKQMSRLIELAKQDCIENDIPTWDEDELQRLCDEWGVDNG